jgi:hypothetical protein
LFTNIFLGQAIFLGISAIPFFTGRTVEGLGGREWQRMAENGRPAGDGELILALLPRSTLSASVRMVNEMAS